jgi:hypothetical protein
VSITANLLPYSAAHEPPIIEGISGGGGGRREVQRSAQAKGERHGLVDALNAAGHHVVEEDEGEEEGAAGDGRLQLAGLRLLQLLLLRLVVARHSERQARQHQETQAEQDAPGACALQYTSI